MQEHEKYDSKELFDSLENTKSSLQELQEKFIQLAEDLEEQENRNDQQEIMLQGTQMLEKQVKQLINQKQLLRDFLKQFLDTVFKEILGLNDMFKKQRLFNELFYIQIKDFNAEKMFIETEQSQKVSSFNLMHAVHKALELVLYVAINKSLKLIVEIEQKSDFEHYININGDKNCIF